VAATRSDGSSPVPVTLSLHDRIAFLMSIKEEGRAVSLDHIMEKVTRDMTFLREADPVERDYREAFSSLVTEGLIAEDGKGFYRRRAIDAYVSGMARASREVLNRSYYLVYCAERYYPLVVDIMLPYLVDRPLSAVKVFSGRKDPIKEVEAIFVRYAKYKPKPVSLTVRDKTDVMRLVHDHCVDFVPYVHGFDGRPDIFLIDLDLGDDLAGRPDGISYAGHAAAVTFRILKEAGCRPMVKFSGSRGFQVLCRIGHDSEPLDFGALRHIVRAVQMRLEVALRDEDVRSDYASLPLNEPFTTSQTENKEARKDQILVDWSSMKPQGDYRSPFSLHHRTGLVSLPLELDSLRVFGREMADPLLIVSRGPDFSFARNLSDTAADALLSLSDGHAV
jgi:DNA primase